MKSRAQRRHDAQRARAKAKRIIKHIWYFGTSWKDDPDLIESSTRKRADHFVSCSNPWCCGNPRRQRGTINDTFAELKSKRKLSEELSDE